MSKTNATVTAGEGARQVSFSNFGKLTIIAGPCQMETREHSFMMAGRLVEICDALGIGLVYKSSFDKANRTSLSGKRGIGLEKSLEVFADLKKEYGFPVLTDIHTEEQCAAVAGVVDILQIPAFLSRQTDLLVAAAKTGRVINVKKGQFLAPWDMKNVLAKLNDSGNPNILLCERGASFGYNTLVSDMRSLPIMAAMGAPVIFDATHSVQQPGGQGASTGGDRRDRRMVFLKNLDTWGTFGRGWTSRVSGVRAAALAMSKAKPTALPTPIDAEPAPAPAQPTLVSAIISILAKLFGGQA